MFLPNISLRRFLLLLFISSNIVLTVGLTILPIPHTNAKELKKTFDCMFN